MNILWTGSHGFIAGYTIQKLLDDGHNVWGIDNFWKYGEITKSYDNHPNFHFIRGDAKNNSLLIECIRNNKIDVFVAGAAIIGGISMFHELAYDILSENEKLTCTAFDVCVETYKEGILKKIIVISSSMVFENVDHYPSCETDLQLYPSPSSTYGFQKLSTEYFAKGANEQYGLPYVIIRPFNAIGIGEQRSNIGQDVYSGNIKLAMSHVLPDLVQKIYKGQNPLHILGSGYQIRHYTYAGDLATAITTCIYDPKAINNDFNISTNVAHNVIDLAKTIWTRLGKNIDDFSYVSDVPYKWDVQKRVPDVSKALHLLGIECNTSLEEALEEIIPWIIEQIENGSI